MEKILSVIIPCYNAQLTIQNCVKSILATEQASLKEVILVDDASTDNTLDIANSLAHANAKIKVVVLSKNGGPARARNIGASHAAGECLLFVDSDTEVLPDTITNFIARIPEADAVTGIYDHRPLNSGLTPLYKATLNYYLFFREGLIPYETFTGSCAGIWANTFKSLGGFDETLAWGMDYECEEFGRRIVEKHKMLQDPKICVRHNFPGIKKLTRVYFLRVAGWMEFRLVKGHVFESTGPAAAQGGIGTAAVPVWIGSAFLAFFEPLFLVPAALFLVLYLRNYFGYFYYLSQTRPTFLPAALVLNVYFSTIITCGALYGALRSAIKMVRK